MKYLVGLGIFFVVIVVAIALLVTRSPKTQTNDSRRPRTMQATDYGTDHSKVIYTLQGPVVGNDARRAVKITVDSKSRVIEELRGYQNQVAKAQTFDNNIEGYQFFLSALNTAKYTNERRTKQQDAQGACPLGQVYIFQIFSDGEVVMNRWSTSCGGEGTFGGNINTTKTLFQKQITPYSEFITGIDL